MNSVQFLVISMVTAWSPSMACGVMSQNLKNSNSLIPRNISDFKWNDGISTIDNCFVGKHVLTDCVPSNTNKYTNEQQILAFYSAS